MKMLLRFGKLFLCIIIGFIIFWSAFNLISRLINPTKYPMLFGYSEAGIAGGSMEPSMSQGDHVIFRKQETYMIDDVVIYYDETDEIFVVHRIVGVREGNFILKGDYNLECDKKPVEIQNIQGKVILVLPNLQSYLLIAFGSLATISIQMVLKNLKLLKFKKHKERG